MLELRFRSLGQCDGCGCPLEARDQLAGLCPGCQSENRIGSRSEGARTCDGRRDRRGLIAQGSRILHRRGCRTEGGA